MADVMQDWAAAIDGHEYDLDDARRLFGRLDARPVRIGTIRRPDGVCHTALFADEFSAVSSGADARDIAIDRLLLNSILFVKDPGREPLRILSIHRRTEQGWDMGTIFGEAHAVDRSDRVVATAVVADSDGQPASPDAPAVPREVRWMRLATEDDDVRDVLFFLRARHPDWFDLYKAVELMRDASGQPWWPKGRYKHFKRSAQPERHARSQDQEAASIRRMQLDDARVLVRWLAEQWLEWKAAKAGLLRRGFGA